jgi:hypothetical protein
MNDICGNEFGVPQRPHPIRGANIIPSNPGGMAPGLDASPPPEAHGFRIARTPFGAPISSHPIPGAWPPGLMPRLLRRHMGSVSPAPHSGRNLICVIFSGAWPPSLMRRLLRRHLGSATCSIGESHPQPNIPRRGYRVKPRGHAPRTNARPPTTCAPEGCGRSCMAPYFEKDSERRISGSSSLAV